MNRREFLKGMTGITVLSALPLRGEGRRLKMTRPNVIFVNGNHTLMGILSFILRGCKIVCYYHWLPPTLEWKSLFIKPLRILEKLTMLKCIAIANSIFTAQVINREMNVSILSLIHI